MRLFSTISRHNRNVKRPGVIIPLLAILLTVLFLIAAYSVDLAYMELVKTEMRKATDTAALAAASALVQGQSQAQVQGAAINNAALNTIAGKPLVLTTNDIVLGQTLLQPDGTYLFQAGLQPYQAVQVNSSLSNQNANGNVLLFFAKFAGVQTFSPSSTAVAAVSACDVVLALDRSHSMCWDESGVPWSYPTPEGVDHYGVTDTVSLSPSGLPSGAFQQFPPIAGSRWIALQDAVQSFCTTLGSTNNRTNVAVVSWASEYASATTYSTILPSYTLPASSAVSLDVDLTNSMSAVTNAVAARSGDLLLGGTDMYTGIEQSIGVVMGTGSRPSASKVIILMTDGDWSSPAGNPDPIWAAYDAKANNITIHCICFTQNANQVTCQSIAAITGGKFYYASDAASLTAIFQEVAGTMPVALTE